MLKMAEDLDLDNRDPNSLNEDIKIHFEDAIGEPEGVHSVPCAWTLSYKCYNGGKNCCYKFLTTLCAAPAALFWGCHFGLMTCLFIWCFTPCFKCFYIIIECMRRFYQSCVDCYCGALCSTYGLIFSRITVTQKTG